MASKKFKFTLARLKELPETGSTYTVIDTETPHLQCIISPLGKKTFQIYRRVKGESKPVRVKIPHASNLKQIRADADAINALMSSGINPNEKRKLDTALSLTLDEAFDQYVSAKNLADSTLKGYKKALTRMEKWKKKPLKDITKTMVLELYNTTSAESHAAAMRTAQVLRAVWNFTNDLTDDDAFGRSPTIILNKHKKKWSKTTSKNRKISADNLPSWFEAIRLLPIKNLISHRMAAYLEFLILTGLRRREAGFLLWKDVNINEGYFIVRNTKNHSDHCLPITERTRQLLMSMRDNDNNECVFGIDEPKKAIAQVIKICSIEFSCHDLRRSFATLADHSGAGSFAIKGILNHAGGNDVTAAHYASYSPLDTSGNVNLDEIKTMKESLQKIEHYILIKAKVKNILKAVK